MRLETLTLDVDSIEVQAVLQRAGWAATGGAAKRLVQAGKVRVNGVVEMRRSHLLHPGDRVAFGDLAVLLVFDDH